MSNGLLDVGGKGVFELGHFSLRFLQHTNIASEGVLSTSSVVKQDDEIDK